MLSDTQLDLPVAYCSICHQEIYTLDEVATKNGCFAHKECAEYRYGDVSEDPDWTVGRASECLY